MAELAQSQRATKIKTAQKPFFKSLILLNLSAFKKFDHKGESFYTKVSGGNILTASIISLFFISGAWFFSQFQKPIMGLLAAIMTLLAGFAAEAVFANLLRGGGLFFDLIYTVIVMLVFFLLGAREFAKYLAILFSSKMK